MNKKQPEKMKDENMGKIMTHYIGLRSKLYCIKDDGQNPTKNLTEVVYIIFVVTLHDV